MARLKTIFFANTSWYLYNFRLELAKYLRDREIEVIMLSPPGHYGELLRKEGFRWIPVPMNRRSMNLFRELKLLLILRGVIKKEAPDVIHNFTLKCVVYGSLASSFTKVRAKIQAITGLGHVYTGNKPKTRILRLFLNSALWVLLARQRTYVVVQNPDDFDVLVKNGLGANHNLFIIKGSGVDTNHYMSGNRIDDGRVRILLACRLLVEKGVREYVEASKILTKEFPELQFLLAGNMDSGNPTSICQEELVKWVNSKSIVYLGHIREMKGLLETIDIAVLPSYREGLPRSLIEAASMRKPVIATDVPGCREVVKHKVNGLLVPLKDVNALSSAIRYLYRNPQLRQEYGERGRELVIRKFSQDRVFRQTYELYRRSQTH